MKRILIASYYFFPENVPRAFRTFELAKEFSRRGFDVRVVIPDTEFDYFSLEKKYNFSIIKLKTVEVLNCSYKKVRGSDFLNTGKFDNIKRYVSRILYYFFGEKKIQYSYKLCRYLNRINEKFDYIISISYPVYVHFGIALASARNKNLADIKIADCGDPFYYHEMNKLAFYFKYFEKWIFRRFDYITVPTRLAVQSYLEYKSFDRIKVIPQGFDFATVKLADYKKNTVPTFGYAGAFLEIQRDPKQLFEYLIRLRFDFRFMIFFTKPETSMKLISRYIDKLKNKIIIKYDIPREEVLFELSKCDFLINVENMSTNQVPSKLIDYMLVKRPVFSFAPDEFDPDEFDEFLRGSYKKAFKQDIGNYNIKKIVDDFLALKK